MNQILGALKGVESEPAASAVRGRRGGVLAIAVPSVVLFALGLAIAACGDDGDDPPNGDGDADADADADADGDADGDGDGDGQLCPSDALQDALESALTFAGAPGGTMAVEETGGCVWSGAAGHADVEADTPVAPDDLFRAGGITTSFTAAVVLLLVEDGALSLDETIDRWWPRFPYADRIRIRHLLSQTSGVYDYAESPESIGEGPDDEDPPWASPTTHERLIQIAAAGEPYGPPGTLAYWSSTNFIMLGLIIEDVTGSTWAVEVRRRLLDKLGLDHTFLEGDEPVPGLVHGYRYDVTTRIEPSTGETIRDAEMVDDTSSRDPSWTWAAGSVVSTSADLARWAHLLYGGAVLSDASQAEMLTPVVLPDGTASDFGFGVIVSETDFGPCYWHDGLANGFNAELALYPEHGLAVASVINVLDDPGGSHSAVGNALYELIEERLEQEGAP